MFTRFSRIRKEEDGVALVLALMILVVVLLLSAAVYAQAIHNSTQSGLDRNRTQSVDAAEAGLDYFYNCVEQTQAASLTTCATTGNVGVSPGTSAYSLTATWYADASGTVAATQPFSDTNRPQSVKAVSVGTTNGVTTRKMESFMALSPTFGGFGGAVVTDNSITLVNSFVISGNSILDGDVYVTCENSQATCNAALTSGNQTIKGSIYVPKGSLSVSTGVHIYGTAWANGAVTVNHPQVLIDHDATSSTSSLSVTAGNVTGTGTYCTGSAPSSTNVHGGTVKSCQGPPPTPAFPHLGYDDTAAPLTDAFWRTGCSSSPLTDCYALVSFGSVGDSSSTGCTAARNYIEGTGAGTFNGGNGVPSGYSGVIVRILSTCTYNSSNNANITVGGDLGIISNGSIQFSQQSTWTGACAPVACAAGYRKMFLIVPWPQTNCPRGDITVGNNTNINSLISVALYTPCTAHMSNQNAFYGQVVGGSVDIGNNWNMNYRPVIFPGAHATGFKQDIAYIREIA